MTILAYAVGFQETHVHMYLQLVMNFHHCGEKLINISKDDPYLHNHGHLGDSFFFFFFLKNERKNHCDNKRER